jgi:hypothetical protein
MPAKRQQTQTDPSPPAKRRSPRAVAPRPDVGPLNRVLEDREQQQRQSQDNPSSPTTGTFTAEQMQIMALQPDPSNPNRALRRTDRPPLSPKVTIPNLDFSVSPPVSRPCSPERPLTTQTLQEDARMNRHHITYRGEVAYDRPTTTTLVTIPPSSSHIVIPMASHMAPIGATSNIAPWEQNETAIAVRNNSALCGALTAAHMLIQSPYSVRHAAEMETQNNADMARAMTAAQAQVQNNRAQTTRDEYSKKQEEWKTWCTKREFQDTITVTPSKLVLWLQEEIIPVGNRSEGRKKGAILSVSGLESYIKPIVALYEVFPLPINRR